MRHGDVNGATWEHWLSAVRSIVMHLRGSHISQVALSRLSAGWPVVTRTPGRKAT